MASDLAGFLQPYSNLVSIQVKQVLSPCEWVVSMGDGVDFPVRMQNENLNRRIADGTALILDFLPVLKGGDSGIQAEAWIPRFRGQAVAWGPRVAAPRLAWSIARRA